MFVITADQVRSRQSHDRVPDVLRSLALVRTVRDFERTAGDEVQGVIDDVNQVILSVQLLGDQEWWRIGVGVGSVEQPLPASTRAGRGHAFIAARAAVDAAARMDSNLAVRVEHGRSGDDGGVVDDAARLAEAALVWLMRLRTDRTAEGREVIHLLERGMSQVQIADRLNISQSAVSQRVKNARWHDEQRAVSLARFHLDRLNQEDLPQ